MEFTQPNPAFKSPADLNARDREHCEVGRSLDGWFTRAYFLERYRAQYPQRNAESIIPSDYCFGRDNKGNTGYPRFFEWDEARGYRFVGLEGN